MHVKKGEPRDFAVFVYNAAPDEMDWEATVRDGSGAAHRAMPEVVKQARADDVTKMMFRYDPAELAAGSGTLAFTIHRKGSSDERQASVGLTIDR